jgi:hypothetical protein
VAWEWLKRRFPSVPVFWRSSNRRFLIADGDPGDDSLGYDFEVLTRRARYYYEVKASVVDPEEFELSEAEVRFALSKAHLQTYRVLYIAHVGQPADRRILPLPNPLAPASRGRYRVSETGVKYAFKTAG